MTRTQPTVGVYTNLADLVALQHRARGYSFLPRQPVHSLLAGRHASRLRRRGLNFEEIRRYIISDGSGNNVERRRLLTRIAQHNDVLFAFVHDPFETDLPDAGPLVFGDGTRQMEAETGNRNLRQCFRETFEEQRAAGRKFRLQRETPVIPLSTSEGVSDQLRRQLGARLR